MKKLDTYYSTISYNYRDFKSLERRTFLTESAARKNAINDNENSGFILYKSNRIADDNDRVITKDTFIAQIVSAKEPETKYYLLCGVDENNNTHPIQAFNYVSSVKDYLPKIDKEYNYKYYNLYNVTENLINDGTVQTYEFFATLPSHNTKVVNYYSLSATNKFDIERQIAGFRTLEETENYVINPSEEYTEYKFSEILLIFSEEEIIERSFPIKQINNKKENKKRTRKK